MLISETKHIELYYQPGDQETLLVAFAPLQFKAEPSRFWADKVVKKIGYSCLGFMDKWSTWYPADEMRTLVEFAKPYLSSHKRVIAYGTSMGGYAVLKYGRLVGADFMLALSPQFSIDPADVRFDVRYHHFFSSSLHTGMRIQAGDTGDGRTFIISDPWFDTDAKHVELIRAACPETIYIRSYMTGHSPIKCFANTERLTALFAAACDSNPVQISLLIKQGAKTFPPMRIIAAIEQNIAKRPLRSEQLLNSFADQLTREDVRLLRRKLIECLVTKKAYKDAARNALAALLTDPNNSVILESLSDCLFELKEDDAAVIWLRRALDADPTRYSSYFRLAKYMARKGDFQAAISAATEAVKTSNEHPVMMHNLSDICSRAGETEMALIWAVKAADKAPHNISLQIFAARLFARQDDHANASNYLTRVPQAELDKDHRLASLATEILNRIALARDQAYSLTS